MEVTAWSAMGLLAVMAIWSVWKGRKEGRK